MLTIAKSGVAFEASHLISPRWQTENRKCRDIDWFWKKILSTLYRCIAKQLLFKCSFVLKDHIVLNISDVVLQINNFTVICECPITFYTFLPKINFSTPNNIWDILFIENLDVHLSFLHFQLYKNVWFVDIWQQFYDLHSFDCEMVQIWHDMNM